MVLSISPGAYDEKTDYSILKIKSKNGITKTPMRVINRNDILSKNKLGADVSLSWIAKSVFYEIPIDDLELNRIIYDERFTERKLAEIAEVVESFSASNSLFLLYPNLINSAYQTLLRSKHLKTYLKKFCSLAKDLGLESIILPQFKDVQTVMNIVKQYDLQYIPIIDSLEQSQFDKQLSFFENTDCVDAPLMALKFHIYPNSRYSYDRISNMVVKLHDKNKGIIMLETNRSLNYCNFVSGIHYSSFFHTDLIAEKYNIFKGKKKQKKEESIDEQKKKNVSWFLKEKLQVMPSEIIKYDFKKDLELFNDDPPIKDLFKRIVEKNPTDQDLESNYLNYFSRLYENIKSRPEFLQFQKHIDSGTSSDYLNDKNEMKKIIDLHFKRA